MGWSRLDLGVGVIVTTGLDLIWDQVADLVDVVEVEPQTMWLPRPGGWDLVEPAFRWVAACGRPALVHGVGFPVGGCQPPDPAGVALTAGCAARLGAAHWSEHLSFNRAVISGRGVEAGFLLPPAQTAAGVAAAVEHVAAYQRAADLPFLIETGVNYLRPRAGELSDGAYIADVAERADCGILLDLHNLLTNQRNGRQPVAEVLDELPLDRVLEVHVAGGFEVDGYYLDAHVGGPDAELLALTASVLPRLPNVRAVMFEAVPEALVSLGASGVREVLVGLHRVVDGQGVRGGTGARGGSGVKGGTGVKGRTWVKGRERRPGRLASAEAAGSVGSLAAARDWERALVAYTSRRSDQRPASDPGIDLLRRLADANRLGELTLASPDLLGRLLAEAGAEATRRLLFRYLRACPPRRWTAEEGAQFASWLAENEPRVTPRAGHDASAGGTASRSSASSV
jgi:uncharacterized protein (UPF0276 family)